MRFSTLLLLLLCAIGLSSCLDIEEDIWIEKDGSGRTEYTIDLSQLYDFIADESSEQLGKMDEDVEISTKDSLSGKLAELFQTGELDTIFYLSSLMEEDGVPVNSWMDSLEQDRENLTPEQELFLEETIEMVQNLQIRLQLSKADRTVRITGIQDFDNIDDRFSLGRLMNRLEDLSSEENNLLRPDSLGKNLQALKALTEMGKSAGIASIDKRIFSYQKTGMDWSELSDKKEELAMMKMFLSNGTYRLRVHFPGKVKKILSGKGVEQIDQQTVELERPLGDLFKPDLQLEMEVKFKGMRKSR
ncbi:MAG: hypothetical protein AAFY48_08370 [Bacteroidota bacterium]